MFSMKFQRARETSQQVDQAPKALPDLRGLQDHPGRRGLRELRDRLGLRGLWVRLVTEARPGLLDRKARPVHLDGEVKFMSFKIVIIYC